MPDLIKDLLLLGLGSGVAIMGYFLKRTIDRQDKIEAECLQNRLDLSVLTNDHNNKHSHLVDKFDTLAKSIDTLTKKIDSLNHKLEEFNRN